MSWHVCSFEVEPMTGDLIRDSRGIQGWMRVRGVNAAPGIVQNFQNLVNSASLCINNVQILKLYTRNDTISEANCASNVWGWASGSMSTVTWISAVCDSDWNTMWLAGLILKCKGMHLQVRHELYLQARTPKLALGLFMAWFRLIVPLELCLNITANRQIPIVIVIVHTLR